MLAVVILEKFGQDFEKIAESWRSGNFSRRSFESILRLARKKNNDRRFQVNDGLHFSNISKSDRVQKPVGLKFMDQDIGMLECRISMLENFFALGNDFLLHHKAKEFLLTC